MPDYPVKVTVLTSSCPRYKAGDVICFKGSFLDKEHSDDVCMVAMSAIYPFIYSARRGGWVKDTPIQCPDCKECVTFKVERTE